MGAFILVLGVIYGRLFHIDLATYMPYLSVGYIVWGFMSAVANDSCGAFHEGSRIIKQIKLPFSTYVFRVICRNFIVFLHTIVIFIPVAIYFQVVPDWNAFLAFPGLILVIINATWVAAILAIVSTRYRDIQPIVATIVQLMMFATPIMWTVTSLGNARIVAEINPIYHLIEIVRESYAGLGTRITLVARGRRVSRSGISARDGIAHQQIPANCILALAIPRGYVGRYHTGRCQRRHSDL